MKAKLVRLLRQIAALVPSKLPTGVLEFDTWSESFFKTYDLPTQDKDSVKYALATMIMHSGPTTAYKSKLYFYLALSAGAAKQVAGSVFYEIKEAQKKAAQANTDVQSKATA